MRFSIKVKIIALCSLFLFIFIPTILFLLMNLAEIVSTYKDSIYTSEKIVAKSHGLGKLVVDMETGQRGFIITGQDEFLEPYLESRKRFGAALEGLRVDLSGRPKYLELLDQIEQLHQKWLALAGEPEIQARVTYDKNPKLMPMDDFGALLGKKVGKGIIDETRQVIDEFTGRLEIDLREEFSQAEGKVVFANYLSMAVGFGGILLSVIFAWILIRTMINPIKDLVEGTGVIGKGDLDHKIKIKSKDELGVLADSFNRMTEDLKQYSYDLTKANESLEQKVQARTKELQETKDLLEIRVQERTKELEQNVNEITEMNILMSGRELRMIELKKEINGLCQELGRLQPYVDIGE